MFNYNSYSNYAGPCSGVIFHLKFIVVYKYILELHWTMVVVGFFLPLVTNIFKKTFKRNYRTIGKMQFKVTSNNRKQI